MYNFNNNWQKYLNGCAAEVTQPIETDLKPQKIKLKELQIERAYLTSHLVKQRARYFGLRKNIFDLRRIAVVHNIHVLAQMALPNSIIATAYLKLLVKYFYWTASLEPKKGISWDFIESVSIPRKNQDNHKLKALTLLTHQMFLAP